MMLPSIAKVGAALAVAAMAVVWMFRVPFEFIFELLDELQQDLMDLVCYLVGLDNEDGEDG